MAVEVVQFLVKKFVDSFTEEAADAEAELPFRAQFHDMRAELEKAAVSPANADELRECLYELNDLLAECRRLANRPNHQWWCFAQSDAWRFPKTKKRVTAVRRRVLQCVEIDSGGNAAASQEDAAAAARGLDRWTSSWLERSRIHGFDQQLAELESMAFRDCGAGRLNGVGIVGMGGIGKTALAQLLFSSPRAKGRFFPRIWMCMSRTASAGADRRKEVSQGMLMALGHEEDAILSIDGSDSLAELVIAVHEQLKGKRFLIVFDDVWHIDSWYYLRLTWVIVISCSMDNQTMDTEVQAMKTDSIFQNSYFRTKHFSHSIEPNRYLEINGTIGVPSDLDGILGHAELISLKRLAMATQLSDLNISSMEAVRELWVENCEHLESFLTAEVVQALSEVGNLHNLWISNMEKLSSFCKGVEDVTSFSCLKHLLFDCCPNLICLFPSVLHFPNLETLHIRFCDILERVFDSSALGEDTLRRLQSLQLWELPELTSVCSGVLPSLKNLKVRGCAKLRKIPVGVNENSPFVTTIGEQLWWDSLIWDDETIKRWLLFRNWRPLLPHIATEG